MTRDQSLLPCCLRDFDDNNLFSTSRPFLNPIYGKNDDMDAAASPLPPSTFQFRCQSRRATTNWEDMVIREQQTPLCFLHPSPSSHRSNRTNRPTNLLINARFTASLLCYASTYLTTLLPLLVQFFYYHFSSLTKFRVNALRIRRHV